MRITEFLCVIFISSRDVDNKKAFSGKQKQKISAELLCPSMPWGGGVEVNNVCAVGPAPTDFTIQIERRYFGEIQRGS